MSTRRDWTSTGCGNSPDWRQKSGHQRRARKLPLSFRLMSVARLEIEVFAAVCRGSQLNGMRSCRFRRGQDARPRRFPLARELDRGNPHQCLLWDLARHERRPLDALGRRPQVRRLARPKSRRTKAAKLAAATTPRIAGENRAARDDTASRAPSPPACNSEPATARRPRDRSTAFLLLATRRSRRDCKSCNSTRSATTCSRAGRRAEVQWRI